jgi:membrane associated rhomboid family serine protease
VSFSFDSFAGTAREYRLRGDRRPVLLDDRGVRHPRSARSAAEVFTRYEDLTDLALTPYGFWLAARDSVYVIPRASFANYDAPERLLEALRAQVSELPDGTRRLEKMERLDALSRRALVPRATWALMALCVVVYIAQLTVGVEVTLAGRYSPELVAKGDLWRLLTANLLHSQGYPLSFLHITLNMFALWIVGAFVERPLGSSRTVVVMASAGAGAMFTAGLFGEESVVGASGIVFGLVGAMLWLDYRHGAELPALWRFPRRSLWLLLAINAVLGVVLPVISLAAHVGGFVSGALAAALVCRRITLRVPTPIRALAAVAVALTAASIVAAGVNSQTIRTAIERYAVDPSLLPDLPPEELNYYAWTLATSPDVTEQQLEFALRLAERAVRETHRSVPEILDTLAEVQFQLGLDAGAVRTIDEAIALAPEESYYREQRRRFTGERARDDRPQYVPPPYRDSQPTDPPIQSEPGDPGLTA